MAPDKIFVPTRFRLVDGLRVRESDTDEEYIRKDALLEKLNRARELRIKGGQKESSDGIRVIDALTDLINRI